MTIDEAINNLKRGKCIPYKHETMTLVIKSLETWEKVKEEIWDYIQYNYDIEGANECNKIFDKYLKEIENDNSKYGTNCSKL